MEGHRLWRRKIGPTRRDSSSIQQREKYEVLGETIVIKHVKGCCRENMNIPASRSSEGRTNSKDLIIFPVLKLRLNIRKKSFKGKVSSAISKLPGEAAEAAEQISILEGHGRALMQTDATFRQQPDLLPCFQCRIQRQIQALWVISRKLNYISGVPACPHSHGTALPANN